MKHESKTSDSPQRTTSLEEESLRLLGCVEVERSKVEAYYPQILNQDIRDSMETEVEATIDSLHRARNNIALAAVRTHDLADELEARYTDLERTEKKRRIIKPAPANSTIDHDEIISDHFAQGLNLYKILWICFIGSFAGVVVELLWCLFRYGYLESRSGLIYGPFNLLYGVGAVALSLALYRFRNRGPELSFVGGFVVGSVLEYVCSWAQEMLLGSVSWDYSDMPFNLNGRICLLYSIFWGVLGILWIKDLYPRTAKLIMKLPNKAGKILTWAVTAFFIVNIAVSCVSVYRWTERMDGVEPSNGFWENIDEHFPDERMENVFANMVFVED